MGLGESPHPLGVSSKRAASAEMYEGQRICIVVPAYREERLIAETLRAIPDWVDDIVVVDDASPDATASRVAELNDSRVLLHRRNKNGGVGRAIVDGYDLAVNRGADAVVVMAGDNQMDPIDLPTLLTPMALDGADYVKGNRLVHPEARVMPPLRRWGSRNLAVLTSLAAGTQIGDSQCGYTAISRRAARLIVDSHPWGGYGYPNDFLILLARRGLSIIEVPVRPVYDSELSGLRPWHAATILGVIARRWVREFSRNVRSSS